MSGNLAETAGDALRLLAQYENLTAAAQNYKSNMYASLLACQLRDLLTLTARTARISFEDGRDTMAHDAAELILDLRRKGASASDIADGLEDLLVLRLMTSMTDAVTVLTEDDGGGTRVGRRPQE